MNSLNEDHVKPTKEFERAIEKAIDSMNPFKALQDIFDEYGHLFSQRIILGRSLKSIDSSTIPCKKNDKIYLNSPILESLKSHLDELNVSYFLTAKGRSIEKNDLLRIGIKRTNRYLRSV